MTPYDFQCQVCHEVFTVYRDPGKSKRAVHCGKSAHRVFKYAGFKIDQVNGPDGINMGLGKHFESAKARDYYAESHGLQKVKDG